MWSQMASYGKQGQFQRRAGLTRDSRTPSLLKVVNGQVRAASQMTEEELLGPPEDDEDEISEPSSPEKSRKGATALAKQSTSSPANSLVQKVPAGSNDVDSDDEYAAKHSLADIKPIWRGNSKEARGQRSREQSRAFSASQDSRFGLKRSVSSQDSSTQARGSKRSSPDLTSPSPPLKKSRSGGSDTGSSQGNRPKGLNRSFSKKDNGVKRRLEESRKRVQEKKAVEEAKRAQPLTPEKKLPSFKSYDDDPFEKFDIKASPKGFINPEAPLLTSPVGSPRKRFIAHPSLSPGSSPAKTTTARFRHPSASFSQSPEKRPVKLGGSVLSPKEVPPKLKDPFAELSDLDMSDESTEEIQATTSACPLCKKPVDKDSLDSFFSAGSRLNVKKQLQFHRMHKKTEAKVIWKTRGFPEIDWEELGIRLTDHYDFLEEIIRGGSSHYGALLSDTVKEGKNRTLIKAQNSLTPGYYGPRGLRALSEDIIARFSCLLRERAVDDRLISSRGYSSYVEAVLVPELAVRLICEDMNVEPEAAREILEESKEVGDLLQEEIGDTIVHVNDDERDY